MKESGLSHIDELIRQNQSFAIYRIPFEKKFRMVSAVNGSVRLFNSIDKLNNQSGYVIAPFHISKNRPIILIQGDEQVIDIPEHHFQISQHRPVRIGKPSEKYADRLQLFLTALQSGKLEKLVLSRSLTLERKEFSPADAFLSASERYFRSYVYLCHTPQTGTWLGSTPEILLSGRNGSWHTVALAGTQSYQEGKQPVQWNEKNRKEQQLVAGYIRTQLATLDIYPEEEGPYSVRAGELVHLKSDFRFSLPDESILGDVLKLLHPTPAICGIPKEKAYNFILHNEGYDRKYYSGFIGWLNPQGQTDLYVNLRCMEIGDDNLTLYAGGGILPSSTLEEEWQETEDKLQTMKRLIN